MNKKNLGILSVVLGALSYLYMITITAIGTGEGLSLTTFGLWSALAWITVFGLKKKKVNPSVVVVYGIGASTTTLVLLIKGRYGWTNFDTLIAALVVLCVVLWFTKGPMWAIVMSVTAGAIAATPFIYMTWQAPEKSLIIPNAGFLATNTLSLISAKALTLEDCLYPVVNVIVCALLVVPWLLH